VSVPSWAAITKEFVISYAVFGVAFVLEGGSLLRAMRQLRGEARDLGRRLFEQVLKSNDPTVKTVASEDSAAVIGLVLAAAGSVAAAEGDRPPGSTAATAVWPLTSA